MRKLAPIALICLFSAGCASHTTPVLKLPPEYSPLEEIRERKAPLGAITASDKLPTTIGRYAYVSDLYAFLLQYLPSSVRFRALLLHEQVHAQRQLDMGVTKWVTKYVTTKSFAWSEEQHGWYAEITERLSAGHLINIGRVARSLSGYRSAKGHIVSYETAYKWVEDVIAGNWSPED